jgi:SAM-dependent methyltransferase
MSIALAAAWRPRGEFNRFLELLPQFQSAFSGITITLPPETEEDVLISLKDLPQVSADLTPDWSWGRFKALEGALQYPCSHIQYADFDRLLRWVETKPEEWQKILTMICEEDCLIVGRSDKAYQTHPQALIQTEAISNQVISQIMGMTVDVSAGSKGFSRQAAEYIVANCVPGHALATDAEWPIILNRSGYKVSYVTVDGLDWESADRYREKAANLQGQRAAAENYDADPQNWARRIEVAQEIITIGLEAAVREISAAKIEHDQVGLLPDISGGEDFDFEAVFDVDDYITFYEDSLTPERTQAEVDFLVRELALDQEYDILDLACGFGRHVNELAALGHHVTGVDRSRGFLEIARKAAEIIQVPTTYLQGDMRHIDFHEEFDHVLLLFTSFGYFKDDENLLVLKNVCRALKPGGLFVFDSHNRDSFLKHLLPFWITESGQDLMIDRGSFDTESGRWYNRRIVFRDGVRKDKLFFVRFYNPNEIVDLLMQAGLEVDRMFAGFDSQPLTSESRRMVIIARKPEKVMISDQDASG